MKAPDQIFLFDIDSVLVEPLGYRAALMATLQRFARRIGFDDSLLPGMDTIEYLEAMHITSEWDMAPLILAILVETLAQADPDLNLPTSLSNLQTIPQARAIQKIDYRTPVEVLSTRLVYGEYPSMIALRTAGAFSSTNGSISSQLFPNLAGTSLLKQLLSDTRDPYRSATTRCFQHYSLGSQTYSRVYGIPPEFEAASMLITHDKPLLHPELREELLTLYRNGELGIAAITNRPSSPPREVSDKLLGYAPEAEMALELNGLNEIPLIGFGRLRYVAERQGIETESLLKPSPVHVIAAILAAISGEELNSIQNAVRLQAMHSAVRSADITSASLQMLRSFPTRLNIHVFEDTRWGIEAAYLASEMLGASGIANKVYARGIAINPQKVSALEQLGAVVYDDVSAAIRDCLKSLK